MADELACMVREKMLRILSDMADFEEAAEEFELTMTQGAAAASAGGGQRGRSETPTAPDPDGDKADVIPERLSGEWVQLSDSEIRKSAMNGKIKITCGIFIIIEQKLIRSFYRCRGTFRLPLRL